MNKIKAIIIDDEKMARALLEVLLQENCPEVEIVDLCPNLAKGVVSIHKNKPNLVFLDIEMPGHSGLEIFDFFEEDEIDFSIIFTTAYNQYAVQAFKLSAIDYLLKPIEISDLEKSIERYKKYHFKKDYSVLKENLTNPNAQKLALGTLNSVKFVEINQILFLKAEGAYTDITFLDGKTITISKGLKKFEEIFSENKSFFRCHKSFIININYLTEHVKSDGGYLLINGKYQISISSEKTAELYSIMDWLNLN